MNEQIKQLFEMILTLDRKFTTFANQAGYEFDDEGNATRVAKPAGVVAVKSKRFNFKQALIDGGACPDSAQLFMDARAKKKAVNSEQAYKMFLASLGDYSIPQAVEICAGEQWKGFKVSWAENLNPEIKKRYSFMELAQGVHTESMPVNRIAAPPSYVAEFAKLEQKVKAIN